MLVLDRPARQLRLEGPGFQIGHDGSVPVPAGPAEPAPLHGLRRWLLQLAAISETCLESLRRLPPVELGQTVRTVGRFCVEPALFVALCGGVRGGAGNGGTGGSNAVGADCSGYGSGGGGGAPTFAGGAGCPGFLTIRY